MSHEAKDLPTFQTIRESRFVDAALARATRMENAFIFGSLKDMNLCPSDSMILAHEVYRLRLLIEEMKIISLS